jgi:LacI family transcriptional regulator
MTISEIAKIAKVSPATVSIVLNGGKGVSEETRKRIQRLLKELGYTHVPRKSAQLQKKFCFIKYRNSDLRMDSNDAFVLDLINSVETECRKQGFSLLLTNASTEKIDEMIDVIKANQPSGLFFLGTEMDEAVLEQLIQIDIPAIVLDNSMPFRDMNCVAINNKEITARAIRYLYEQGHSKIGMVASSYETNNFAEREESFIETLKKLDLAFPDVYRYEAAPKIEQANDDFLSQLSGRKRLPTAFFCVNDTIAIGTMRALKSSGYRVPEDISVIGFDDIGFASVVDPSLTTMRVNRQDIGRWAVRLLVDIVRNYHYSAIKIRTSAKLVVRNSTMIYHEVPYGPWPNIKPGVDEDEEENKGNNVPNR